MIMENQAVRVGLASRAYPARAGLTRSGTPDLVDVSRQKHRSGTCEGQGG